MKNCPSWRNCWSGVNPEASTWRPCTSCLFSVLPPVISLLQFCLCCLPLWLFSLLTLCVNVCVCVYTHTSTQRTPGGCQSFQPQRRHLMANRGNYNSVSFSRVRSSSLMCSLCFLWCLHYKKTDDGPNICEAVSCPTPSSSFLNTVLPLQRHHGGFFLFFFSCSCISAASLHIVWLWSRTTEMCPRPLPALSEPSLKALQQILRRASSRTSCLSCFD